MGARHQQQPRRPRRHQHQQQERGGGRGGASKAHLARYERTYSGTTTAAVTPAAGKGCAPTCPAAVPTTPPAATSTSRTGSGSAASAWSTTPLTCASRAAPVPASAWGAAAWATGPGPVRRPCWGTGGAAQAFGRPGAASYPLGSRRAHHCAREVAARLQARAPLRPCKAKLVHHSPGWQWHQGPLPPGWRCRQQRTSRPRGCCQRWRRPRLQAR
jgi:hypothetical protein